MGRTGKTCGAVTGAYMVIGLSEPKVAREGIEAVYLKIQEFNKRFVGLHASTCCTELLNSDLSSPEGLARARAEGLFIKSCPNFVRDAVEIFEEIGK
jgi:C_GCAxxG_C_C family probable redox protein